MNDFTLGHPLRRVYTSPQVFTICALLISPVIRLALLTGPAGSDDLNYFHFAKQLAHLQHFTQLHHHAGRLVFLLVVGVPAALLGSITAGSILNVFVLTIRDIAVVWFVRRETDDACTAVAAGVLAFNSISATYAGLMIPDPLLSLLMFAEAWVLYDGLVHRADSRGRLVLIAGVLTALAYSAKDTGILMVAPSLALIALAPGFAWRERIRCGVLYFVGIVAIAALESLAYYLISGDFLYRTHALSRVHNATIVEAPNLLEFIRAVYWNLRAVTTADAASTPVLIGGALVFVAALALRSKLAFFSASGLFLGLYLIFGSSSFTRMMPLPVQDRYFEPLVAFVAVGMAALVFHFRAPRTRVVSLRIATASVLGLLITSIPSLTANAGDVAFSGVGRNAGVAIRALRVSRPDMPIIVSPMLYRMIEPFVSSADFAALKPMEGEALTRGFYLAHPWESASSEQSMLGRMNTLPVYLVIDEDQRYLGRFSLNPPISGRGAIVHVSSD